jgi:cytosine/adenosine deaminase-related metal-dependent hydrolase
MNPPPQPRTIIRDAIGVMTGLSGPAARATGDVAVEGGRIAAIGEVPARPGDLDIDARGCVVYPGLISTHHHLSQSLLKGIPGGMNVGLAEWLLEVPYAYLNRLDAESFRLAVTIGVVELLLSGVTTLADHHYIYDPSADYDAAEALFETVGRLGPRFVLCRGGATRGSRHASGRVKSIPAESVDQILRQTGALAARHHDTSPGATRRVAMAPTNLIWSVEAGDLRALAAGARDLGIRLHSHLSEDPGDVAQCLAVHGLRPVAYAGETGFLGPDVWFAHLVHVDRGELDLLVQTRTGMAHCPQSNSRLGAGVAPAPRLAAMGGRVSLGVDGAASNESCDMISEMHAALRLHRAVGGPGAVTVEDVVQWATAGGADMLGFPETGRIAPGMLADLAIFDLSHPRYAGLHDPLAGPVLCGGAARVKHLLVGGRTVVENGAVPGVDLAVLAADAVRLVGRLADAR